MSSLFRLTFFALIFTAFTGLAAANYRNVIDIADFASHPEAFEGQVIEVKAKVVAISADSKSLEVFDSESNTLIGVRLTGLRKSERTALMLSDVRRIVVSGRATVIGGRLTIDAQRITVLPLDTTDEEDQLSHEADTGGPR
jgi:hypothetical protein